jgi:hypothetical protein
MARHAAAGSLSDQAKRRMTDRDYAAWMGVRALVSVSPLPGFGDRRDFMT